MILIATACPETLVRCKLGLQNFSIVLSVAESESLKAGMAGMKPRLLMVDLDLPGLNGTRGIASLKNIYPAAKIIVLCPVQSDAEELSLFREGISGCCGIDADPEHLKRIVMAVDRGELWIRRALLPRLLEEAGVRSPTRIRTSPARIGSLAELTQRERQIAVLIGNGESNKQIARQLAITERTVKSHLTEIFRKLGITDRLNLALRMMASAAVEHEPAGTRVPSLSAEPDFHVHSPEPMRSEA